MAPKGTGHLIGAQAMIYCLTADVLSKRPAAYSMKTKLVCVSVFLLVLRISSLRAQAVNSAEIAGVVTDSSGAAVPNAAIKATQTDTQLTRTTVSGVHGAY